MDRECSSIAWRKPEILRPLIALGATGAAVTLFLTVLALPLPNLPDYLVYLISGLLLTAITFALTALLLATREYRREHRNLIQRFRKELADSALANETRQKLEKALLQGQKLQAIGTLAGGIAHDFNNVLYAIIGYTEMAMEDSPPETPLHANLGKILAGAKRGQDLVAKILGFSRRQHADFSPLSMKKTIEEVLDLLIPTIPAGVMIRFNPGKQDCMIPGNQTGLHQVLVNIINNAVDAMEGEGQITLALERLAAQENPLRHAIQSSGEKHFCRITISDTGYGMDAGTLERIFEPFFTTKEVGRGTGLGLSTVHAIIRNHRGEIIATSQPGAGTTFTIFLPEHEVTEVEETTHGKDFAG